MNPKCPSDLCIFDQEERIVVLRPDIPSWAVINREGLSLLNLCTGTRTVEEIAKELTMEAEEVHEFTQTLQEYKILGEKEPIKAITYELRGIWLNVTNACNLNCLTCYQSSGGSCLHELTLKEIAELFQHIRAFKPSNEPQTVILTGGEPLLRSDIWDICQSGKNLGLEVNLITNGTKITEEVARKINLHVNQVQVSLDGMEGSNDAIRGKGAFRQAIKGIEMLLDADIIPSIGVVVTKVNYEDILPLLQLLAGYGITSIRVRPVVHQGRGLLNRVQLAVTDKEYQLLVENIYEEGFSSNPHFLKVERFKDNVEAPVNNAKGCPAGWRMASIASTGEVYPCITGHMAVLCMGSLRRCSFESIWRSDVLNTWRAFDVNASPHCNDCEWRNFCGGGCKVSAFLQRGRIDGGDPYCEALKNLYYYTLMKETSHEHHSD